MFEADIHLRLLHTSIVDIHKVFELLVCCLKHVWLHPYTVTLAKLNPDLGSQCHNIMFEADFYLRLLHTSILDIYKVFQPLVCCLKSIWVQPYSITPSKLPPDLGMQVHLRSGIDATTSWLRLISTSDHFIHQYYTTSILYIYKVFVTLVCCHKRIWVHPYSVTPARLAPDLGTQGHLWS